jgi:hypothetical protein
MDEIRRGRNYALIRPERAFADDKASLFLTTMFCSAVALLTLPLLSLPAVAQTIVNGQIFTAGLAVVDAPALNTYAASWPKHRTLTEAHT